MIQRNMVPEDPGLDRRLAAVHNNVRWCDTLCRAHGVPGVSCAAWWENRHAVPRFHPNLITTAGTHEGDRQRAAIASLVLAEVAPSFSVKDSFACLDLRSLGFHKLFDASWIWCGASTSPPPGGERLRWSAVVKAEELSEWEAAWSDPSADAAPRLFPACLLEEPELVFLAGRIDSEICAGAIANRSGSVVGLSNVFGRGGSAAPHWPGGVRSLREHFPGLPIVGYEAGPDLSAAEAVGFEAIGPLRIWLRDEA